MQKWLYENPAAVAEACSGMAFFASAGFHPISDISIDSRKVGKGTMFVALEGRFADGHDFVASAAKNGAEAVMVSSEKAFIVASKLRKTNTKCAMIVVNNPLRALQKLASIHVEQSSCLRIGITGSCGKTTTKEMLASILSTMGSTFRTPGNMNSEIGLPLAAFSLDKNTNYGVFEMGVDHVGEMTTVSNLLKPQKALITNIGVSHLEKMGSMKDIALEKSKILNFAYEGFIFEDCRCSDVIKTNSPVKLNDFGVVSTKGIRDISYLGLNGWILNYEGKKIHLNGLGWHSVVDAMGAISVAQSLGAERSNIADGLEEYATIGLRSNLIQGNVSIIQDCYNSNPDSCKSILDCLSNISWNGRKAVVLGSMKELGEASLKSHVEVGKKILAVKPDWVSFFGEETKVAYEIVKKAGLGNVSYANTYEECERNVTKTVKSGDIVLLKASRAMEMERLIPVLKAV